jgi:hypothetical protein
MIRLSQRPRPRDELLFDPWNEQGPCLGSCRRTARCLPGSLKHFAINQRVVRPRWLKLQNHAASQLISPLSCLTAGNGRFPWDCERK